MQKKQQTIYLWTDSAKKNNRQFTYGQTVQKNNNNNLHMDRQCKKSTTTIYIWTDSAKKQQQTIYIWTDSAKKKKKKKKIYIWTDSAKNNNKQFTYGQTVQKSCTGAFTVLQTVQKNNNNLHMDSTYLQTIQKTVCKIHVHIVYYKDILNYQRHIHRMGTSTLCTLSIHNVVYT